MSLNTKQAKINLNKLGIRMRDGSEYDRLQDFSTLVPKKYKKKDTEIQVHFKDMTDSLSGIITEAAMKGNSIVGCVAWLTSEPILKAMSYLRSVSIIVQKEDFLRPDLTRRDNWSQRLRGLYDALPRRFDVTNEMFHGTPLELMDWSAVGCNYPIRCVGVSNAEKSSAMPRSHHKFIVLLRNLKEVEHINQPKFSGLRHRLSYKCECVSKSECPRCEHYNKVLQIPYAVWTGSFNFTENAGYSFENAIFIKNKVIAESYFREYCQVAALSEPLDWSSPWVEPQWWVCT